VAPWVAGLVGQPGWRHYLAFDGKRAVATAAMYVDGNVAWIDFASTLPECRGRGAQSALIARRVADCAESGVATMVVETAETSPSRRNLERLGFAAAYVRPNYLLELC
jgi:GNAT superfamily N-acetyltransferase